MSLPSRWGSLIIRGGRGGYIGKLYSRYSRACPRSIIYHLHPWCACPLRVNVRFDSKVFFPPSLPPLERFSFSPVGWRFYRWNVNQFPDRTGKIFYALVCYARARVCVCSCYLNIILYWGISKILLLIV